MKSLLGGRRGMVGAMSAVLPGLEGVFSLVSQDFVLG